MDGQQQRKRGIADKLQHRLWMEHEKARSLELTSRRPEASRRLLEAATNEAASGVLNCYPSDPFELSDETFIWFVKARCGIGEEQTLVKLHEGSRSGEHKCALCRMPLRDDHYMSCMYGDRGELIRRHNRCRDIITRMIASIPGGVARAESHDFKRAHGDQRRPDILYSLREGLSGTYRHGALDVVVTDPLCRSYDRRVSAAEALRDVESEKAARYGSTWASANPERPLLPFGISTYGELGPSAAGFLTNLKTRAQRHKTPYPRRWWASVIACAAIRGSAAIRDGWFRKYSERSCLLPTLQEGASGPSWDPDQIGEGVAKPFQP